MSRKVVLKVMVDVTVRDRDMRILQGVESHARRPGSAVVVSVKSLASELDMSAYTVRRGLASCVEEGYLHVFENRLSNGAQIENSYAVTPSGLAVLSSARACGLVA